MRCSSLPADTIVDMSDTINGAAWNSLFHWRRQVFSFAEARAKQTGADGERRVQSLRNLRSKRRNSTSSDFVKSFSRAFSTAGAT